MNDLKSLADKMMARMNDKYREEVCKVPDEKTVSLLQVNDWVEMPKAFQDATELPGLPIGNITCVYGKPNTGKTTMLMQAIVACQEQGILPVLILTEHKFHFDRVENLMGGSAQFPVFHADSLEAGYSFLEDILRDVKEGQYGDNKVFVFWDSIGNTMSESELDYEAEDHAKSMGKGAKAIKTLTRRSNQLLGRVRDQVGIMFLNQSYQSMPSYGPSVETPYGGDGIPYSAALVMRLRRKGDLKITQKGKTIVIGLETIIQVMKNHITAKQPIASVYTVGSGMIDPSKEALDDYKKKLRTLDEKTKLESKRTGSTSKSKAGE